MDDGQSFMGQGSLFEVTVSGPKRFVTPEQLELPENIRYPDLRVHEQLCSTRSASFAPLSMLTAPRPQEYLTDLEITVTLIEGYIHDGMQLMFRCQAVGRSVAPLITFPLSTEEERQRFFYTLEAPCVGTELRLMELIMLSGGGAGDGFYGVGPVCGVSEYYAFYHHVTHPHLRKTLRLCKKSKFREIEDKRFYPAENIIIGNFVSRRTNEPDGKMIKSENNWKSKHAQNFKLAYELRSTGASLPTRKNRKDYLASPKGPISHQGCADLDEACSCKPIKDAFNPKLGEYLKFDQDNFLYIVTRDLVCSKDAYDLIEHIPLPDAHIVPGSRKRVKFQSGKKGVSFLLNIPQVEVIEMINHKGASIGACKDPLDVNAYRVQSSAQFALNVVSVRQETDQLVARVEGPVSLPADKDLKSFTVLPDNSVTGTAISLLQNCVKDHEIRDPGACDEEYPDCFKCRVQRSYREWTERIWNPVQAPPRSPPTEEALPPEDGEEAKAAKTRGPRERVGGLVKPNAQQEEILHMVVDLELPVTIIWGPPGTGKTTNLGFLVSAFMQRDYPPSSAVGAGAGPSSNPGAQLEDGGGDAKPPYMTRPPRKKRVMVMAPTNTAADALAISIRSSRARGRLTRVYASYYDQKLIPKDLERCYLHLGDEDSDRDKFLDTLRLTSILVLTTATATLKYEDISRELGMFDLVIFDEAGRCNIAECLTPLTLARRAVFCGDHKQMRPYLPQELRFLAHLHWDVSMLELLTDLNHPAIQLVLNYRSVQEVLEPSNNILYHQHHLVAVSHTERVRHARNMMDQFLFLKEYFPQKPGLSLVPVKGYTDTIFGDRSSANAAEAFYIVKFILDAYYSGLVREEQKVRRGSCTIGVVSFYKAQQRLIEMMLQVFKEAYPDFRLDGGWLKILSSERFQGLDAEWILITGCLSSPNDDYKYAGKREEGSSQLSFFLSQYDRINVALTRARCGVVGFLRPQVYIHNPFWRKFIQCAVKNNGVVNMAGGVDQVLLSNLTAPEFQG